MLKTDFLTELRRYFAANKAENDLTPERVAVLWESYQHEPLPRWKAAMSIAIGDHPGRPSRQRIENALDEAERQEQAAKIASDRGQTASPMSVAVSGPAYLVDDLFLAIQRVISENIASGATPEDVAGLLEASAHMDPGTDYREWIKALRVSPTDWRMVPLYAPDGGPLVRDTRRPS